MMRGNVFEDECSSGCCEEWCCCGCCGLDDVLSICPEMDWLIGLLGFPVAPSLLLWVVNGIAVMGALLIELEDVLLLLLLLWLLLVLLLKLSWLLCFRR